MTSPPITPDYQGFTLHTLETLHKPYIGGIIFAKKILMVSQNISNHTYKMDVSKKSVTGQLIIYGIKEE
jgi:hypothetical protein